jgi:GNAT superfamily N-acetyltransferase
MTDQDIIYDFVASGRAPALTDPRRIDRSAWLLHFTRRAETAEAIAHGRFGFGEDLDETLGLHAGAGAESGSTFDDCSNFKVAFAYLLDDLACTPIVWDKVFGIYGSLRPAAVLFRSESAVRAYHKTSGDPQVMFRICTERDLVALRYVAPRKYETMDGRTFRTIDALKDWADSVHGSSPSIDCHAYNEYDIGVYRKFRPILSKFSPEDRSAYGRLRFVEDREKAEAEGSEIMRRYMANGLRRHPKGNPADAACRILSLTDGEGVDHRVEARELFEDVGIRPESGEHLFQACVNDDGEVVAASTVGLYDETPDDGDPLRRPRWRFSVVVDEAWRRKGIARALVRGILDAYPRERFLLEGKVVSPHMAALLDDLGFLYDDEHEEEWSDFDRSWGRRMYLPNPSGHFLDSEESRQENPRARPSPAQIERRAEVLLEAVGDSLDEYRALVADLKELANGGSNEFGEILNWAPGDVLMLLIAVERLRWLCVRSAGRLSSRGDSRDVRYRTYDDEQLRRLADSVAHIRNPRRRNSDADLRELEHVVKTSPRDMAAWGRLQTALRRAGAPAYQGPGYTLWLFNGLRRLTNAQRVRHANRAPEVTFVGEHEGEKIEFWHGAVRVRPVRMTRVRPVRMTLTVRSPDKALFLNISERPGEAVPYEVYRGVEDGTPKPRESVDPVWYSAEDLLRWFSEQPDTPRYTHDCTSCVFLGRHRRADLYVCPRPEHMSESVIARYSSEGSDYNSSPASLVMRRIFTQPPREPATGVYHRGEDTDEAWRRARARDLFLARESRGEDLQRCRYCDGMFVPSDSLSRTHNCHAEYQARLAAARRRCARPGCAETAVVGSYCRPHAPIA